MKDAASKKAAYIKCLVWALAAYAIISFLWVCFIAAGIGNNSTAISVFAERLVLSDLAIALFSAVFGASFLLFESKKLSPQSKRALHVITNYIAAMICVYALFSNVNDAKINTWLVFLVLASAVYFIIYGVAALITRLAARKKLK